MGVMDDTNLKRTIELSQFDYAWDEGYFWSEVSTLFFASRASSSPRKEMATGSAHRNTPATSFDDFQESVSDAWDLGDDEFCVISGIIYIRYCWSIFKL